MNIDVGHSVLNNITIIIPFSEGGVIVHVGNSEGNTKFVTLINMFHQKIYTKYDIKCHVVFLVTMVTIRMTLLSN